VDSPISQLVEAFPDVQHLKTDVFRDIVEYARRDKDALATARTQGLAALERFEASLPDLDAVESGVLIDLFLSYRSVKGWKRMIALAGRMPRPLAATVMVQEQLALALNRDGQSEQAETVVQAVLASRGPSSETYAILGRVYKDRYDRAKDTNAFIARAELEKAIDAYLKGFEADWRDAYPGVNAVTLMELRKPPDPRQAELIPIVTYAVKRRIASGKPDYWDFATLLELAVLARDGENALDALGPVLANVREAWEPETTLRNLRLIAEARHARGEETPEWLTTVLAELQQRAG
jgi:tetratricopeptide (TPR) repeat protein